MSSRQGTGGTGGGRQLATALLALVVLNACFDLGTGFSSGIPCPVDLFSCLGDDECSSCLDALQENDLPLIGGDFELCDDLYASVCAAAEAIGCNTDNEELVEFLTCVADDSFGCGDFTTCADFPAEVETPPPTVPPSPTATTTAAAVPTPAPSFPFPATAAPTAAVAAATSAPSSGSRGGLPFSPTAAPTGGGNAKGRDTASPTPASSFEGFMDTLAPSAAPTGGPDGGLRGGDVFSDTPTAVPTVGFEDELDGVSAGSALAVATPVVVAAAVVFFAATALLADFSQYNLAT
ncbi:unnamed protein product [Ectocarpus sp. CCAP 1310/34]|nr:unnamed protein product [Ectocarpus sp. CCAP 1310/34]